jgi:phosphoribosylaminoimidazole-succinocarboxamide synthase
VLADEVLTPDSSRYWPAAEYAPGGAQSSFDKQYVRDYLESIAMEQAGAGAGLPEDVVCAYATEIYGGVPVVDGAMQSGSGLRNRLRSGTCRGRSDWDDGLEWV